MSEKLVKLVIILSIAIIVACGGTSIALNYSGKSTVAKDENTSSSKNVESNNTTQNTELKKLSYAVADTAQVKCYDNSAVVNCANALPQDANYLGNSPSYTDNNDGTITDNVTGLMWQKDPGSKVSYNEGIAAASSFKLANHSDWRVPTIKELYSLINFDGTDPASCRPGNCSVIPFIDNKFFTFKYGDTAAGDRPIDSQYMSATKYVSTTMNNDETVFGVNFADGRIKGYPTTAVIKNGSQMKYYLLHVRLGNNYGKNDYSAKGGTVIDNATGLTWQKDDTAGAKNWSDAINYCENLSQDSFSDWRLPNAKELQSIVDYTRSPNTTGSAAIDPIFGSASITNEAGQKDWPFYWTSTTHAANDGSGTNAVYISFGRAMGYFGGKWIDVHGAGAQRSDPKTGSASDYPTGNGPQGDAIRILNHIRCVRDGAKTATSFPNSSRTAIQVSL